MKRRCAEESADGLALMTSSVTSSYSADGLREQSQESAAFCSCAKDSADALCVEIQQSQDTSWKHMFNTSWTTRRKQQQHPVVSYNESAVAIYPVDMESQTQEKKKQAKYRDSTSRELQYPVAGNPGARYPVAVMNQQRSS
ncbi:heparanase-like protein 3 [Dorcoceras hygrometricum]|uniref:Heparanase-like protein 3 n=1 Tax=Dorcoceras hygrometricum TaxID=472368 RepID=A0A2Z7CLQ7_9LAMI|nr:heparanase-like protein 3 [Dorcoceras hygrometricum]